MKAKKSNAKAKATNARIRDLNPKKPAGVKGGAGKMGGVTGGID